MKEVTKATICPITGTTDSFTFIDLGSMPLVNSYTNTKEESISAPRYKLAVQYFRDSKLCSLTENVDPNMLFSEYAYKSGVVKAFKVHCDEMYSFLMKHVDVNFYDGFLDIGGNDGTLLNVFKTNNPSLKVLNVDASKNICEISRQNGISTYHAFWGAETARALNRKYKVITSTNVFQHTPPIADYVEGVSIALEDNGVWCLEFPYWKTTMDTNQFDQIYHEHVYFYLLTPLKALFEKYGLEIFRAVRYSIHGGTLRLLIGKKGQHQVNSEVQDILSEENQIPETYYIEWGKKITEHIQNCREFLLNLKSNGANIIGFGAAAKGCIFLNSAGIDDSIVDAIIDDTDLKQNKYMAGTGIRVCSREYLKNHKVDYILLLAHNFKDAIMETLKHQYMGKYIMLFPTPQIL